MASQQTSPSTHLLPQLNPFISLLLDAYVFLNEALSKAGDDPGRAFALARASTMHTIAAVQAAANSALRFEDQPLMTTATLAEKFGTYLLIVQQTGLTHSDIAVLEEGSAAAVMEAVGELRNARGHYGQAGGQVLRQFQR